MTSRPSHIWVIVALLAWPATIVAQAAGNPAPTPAATPAPVAPQTPAPEPYSYNSEGRRDPFVNLMSSGSQPAPTGKRAEGLSGLLTGEVVLNGILQTRGGFVALIKGPDGRTLQAHVNDKLADGTIRSITLQGVVIMQEVNDPLSLVKVKEVRKGLRASDDVKQ
jgi:Tfp pilus assembly protein PilP